MQLKESSFLRSGNALAFLKVVTLLLQKKNKGTTLSEMPVSGGHLLVWLLYKAINAALEVEIRGSFVCFGR